MRWAEEIQAENADLKGQQTGEAEEHNSAIQAISCLETQLEAAERRLKAMRDMTESAQREMKRHHGEARPLFRAQESEPENWFQSPSALAWGEDSPGSCLLSEEDPACQTEEPEADRVRHPAISGTSPGKASSIHGLMLLTSF